MLVAGITVISMAFTGSAAAADTDQPLSPALFSASALGDIADLDKDLVDLQKSIAKGGLFRAVGNVLELSFNMGQLESLTPPPKIASAWSSELSKLDKAIGKVSASVEKSASLGATSKSIAAARAQAKQLASVVRKLR